MTLKFSNKYILLENGARKIFNNGFPKIAKNVQRRRRDLSFPTRFTALIYVSQSVSALAPLMEDFLLNILRNKILL